MPTSVTAVVFRRPGRLVIEVPESALQGPLVPTEPVSTLPLSDLMDELTTLRGDANVRRRQVARALALLGRWMATDGRGATEELQMATLQELETGAFLDQAAQMRGAAVAGLEALVSPAADEEARG